MASQLPTPLPVDAEPSRPTFKRTNSTPHPPQPPSPHRPSSAAVPPLNRRPSAFSLQNSSIPIPPSLPSPALPPRPRTGTMPDGPPLRLRKSSSRPSTASSREEVTPWEFQSSPFEKAPSSPAYDKFERASTPTLKSRASSIKSSPPSINSPHPTSVRSRSSSAATGLVDDVTPWDAYPPLPEKEFKYHNPTHKVPEYSASGPSLPLATSTGPVEDVTPWELIPPPQENLTKPLSRSSSHLASVDETSTLYSYDSNRPQNNGRVLSASTVSSSQYSHGSNAAVQEHNKVQKTGRTEDVTPWELEPGPGSSLAQPDANETKQLASARLRPSMSMAQVEEVTPWELHPLPSIPPPPPPVENLIEEMEESKVNENTLRQKSSRSVSLKLNIYHEPNRFGRSIYSTSLTP